MTSGTFTPRPIDSIVIAEDRQRTTLTGIEELAESIHRLGLINPIVVTDEGVLVAGERRLTACKSLGWTAIPTQVTSDLTDYELHSIELEENIKRVDLTWQDEVAAIAKFHALKQGNEEDWTQQATAEALGMSRGEVTKKLAVAGSLDNETIAGADRFSAAHNMVVRNKERAASSALREVKVDFDAVVAPAVEEGEQVDIEAILKKGEAEDAKSIPLLNTSFHDWQESYDGPKFNLIHCDFPYGINVADAPRMSSTIKDHYDDSPDVYWALLSRLSAAMENVVADSAHLIFWHSMKFHTDTVEALTRMGWTVNPFPFIWHKSDGAGIAPDPQRGPRQTYEAAIFATRGDRKITQAGCVANSFAYPGRRTDAQHVSEKPYKMCHHFLRMICDEYSTVLDPTCGGATALKVCEDLGADSVLGIEQSTEFYERACQQWEERDGIAL